MFLVFLLGGVFGVVIGSINPKTHDFQIQHTATTITSDVIIIDFQIQSFEISEDQLDPRAKDFVVRIPIKTYNDCRNEGTSIAECKNQLVQVIEIKAELVLVGEFEQLEIINRVVQDFSNELAARDFDNISEGRIDDNYRDVIDSTD